VIAQGRPQGKKCGKNSNFWTYALTSASYNSETIEDRKVHAARVLASIGLSFHPCNILRDSRRASLGETKMWAAVRENGDFFNCCTLHNFLTVVNYTIFAAIIDSFMSN